MDRFVFDGCADVQVVFKAAPEQRPAQVQIISNITADRMQNLRFSGKAYEARLHELF